MELIAGVDIGNSTTEVCIGERESEEKIRFLSAAMGPTTGTKGTAENVHGIKTALKKAMAQIGRSPEDLSIIGLNEAAPVIGDTAMETLTETIITDSSMIGHNPSTPAGVGQAVGTIVKLGENEKLETGQDYILAASSQYPYEAVAAIVNQLAQEINIVGIILQADEAVLVENRLEKKIPIIDEVRRMDRLPQGVKAAIEVAPLGQSVRMLSNPYGIATLLNLSPSETKMVTPIAKSLIGKRSAVVLKTPGGNVKEQVLPAGSLYFQGENS